MEYIEKYEIIDIEAEQGDVVFIDMNLIHKSGDNSSSTIRFVATARHHNMLTNEFFFRWKNLVVLLPSRFI